MTVIDIHAHFTQAPLQLDAYRGRQVTNLVRPVKGALKISDEQIEKALQANFQQMADKGIDKLVFSPRASGMGHEFGNALISRYWTEHNNDLIARTCKLFPDKLFPCCQLPQSPGESLQACIEELERCVLEMGFVACNINPDVSGGVPPFTPSIGDEFWYPLWEKMVEWAVPGMIHASATHNPALHILGAHYLNQDQSAVVELCNSRIFDDFPNLRLIIPHGGGAFPYQFSRHRALHVLEGKRPFEEMVRHIYFDTAIYDQDSMELLIKRTGVDNVLYSTEMLGTASSVDPRTGRLFDDTVGMIREIDWLSDEDRYKIFEGNARKLYSRAKW